ncbi:MAG: hypothetical protein M1838_005354 [Thelocarpon superellum]|nr:MAG: hypothetical protein M1838_005354 [Thelocarpon superellum]
MFVPFVLFPVIGHQGVHVKDLTPAEVVQGLKILFAEEILYTLASPTVKISIVLFFYRIFPTVRFRRTCLVVIGCYLAWFIAIIVLDIFQCKPIAYQWDKSLHGECVSPRTFFVGNGVTNVVLDFMILLLPMPMIWKLHQSRANKVALTATFALGSFVCIISIVRAIALSTLDTTDVTYTLITGTIWTFLEISLGLTFGQLPMLRPLFPHIHWGGTSNLSGPEVSANATVGQHTKSKSSSADGLVDFQGHYVELAERGHVIEQGVGATEFMSEQHGRSIVTIATAELEQTEE